MSKYWLQSVLIMTMGITTNHEKNLEMCSPNIWLNKTGLYFSIAELMRRDLLEFQSLMTSHTSLNKPIISFDETWASRRSDRKGISPRMLSKAPVFSLKNIACRVTQNFNLSLKWRLHVFPKCYFKLTMLDGVNFLNDFLVPIINIALESSISHK